MKFYFFIRLGQVALEWRNRAVETDIGQKQVNKAERYSSDVVFTSVLPLGKSH